MGMNLDQLRIGYIIAVRYERKKNFNFFSEGIYQRQLWEGYNSDDALFTHVAISSGRPYLVNVTPPKAKWVEDIIKVYSGCYIKVLKYKGENYDKHLRYKIACFYNAIASNLKYDWFGVISFIIPKIQQIKGRPFCSEACCEAYQKFYPMFFDGKNSSKCMPCYFLNKKGFEIVWEGFV